VPATLQDSLVTLLAIAYVLGIVAVIVLFFHRRRWQAPEESRWLRNLVTVLGLMLLATLIGYWAMKHGHLRQQREKLQPAQGQRQRLDQGRRLPEGTRPARFQWELAVALGGLVGLGAAFVLVRERRALSRERGEQTEVDELIRAVETTIEDLRSERDPRRAVIAAYANMERMLGAHGHARRRAEAPFEYLARILRELNVRESAVRSLTRLYEYAKFSSHEIDAGMKEEAISALMAVRDDLRSEERVAA
jgi:ABC-type nickel/cobalt efflux system permease component RcnA